MKFNIYVQPICLPSSCSESCKAYNDVYRDYAFVTGWGVVTLPAEQGASTKDGHILKKSSVPTVFPETCMENYDRVGMVLPSNVSCAGYPSGGTESCQGDYGGPLICVKNGFYQLDGVSSFGFARSFTWFRNFNNISLVTSVTLRFTVSMAESVQYLIGLNRRSTLQCLKTRRQRKALD